jgi:phage regulator Rha-like protein
MPHTGLALARKVDSIIHLLRGQRIIFDSDLAELYGVSVKHLNQQIKRNARRFPPDFLFQLSQTEYENLRSQIVTSSSGHGGRRYLPLAFTEHGAVMAANVLNSARAIKMSIFVVRAFVRMRETFAANQQLLSKLSELEERIESHDVGIQDLFNIIRQLTAPLPAKHNRIGFELPDAAGKGRRKLHRLVFPTARKSEEKMRANR